MAEEKNLIEITHISKKFGDLTVLKDISVKVKEKEVVVIIGPSGSGKSTLLRCINGLETPTTGSITFDGVPVSLFDEPLELVDKTHNPVARKILARHPVSFHR